MTNVGSPIETILTASVGWSFSLDSGSEPIMSGSPDFVFHRQSGDLLDDEKLAALKLLPGESNHVIDLRIGNKKVCEGNLIIAASRGFHVLQRTLATEDDLMDEAATENKNGPANWRCIAAGSWLMSEFAPEDVRSFPNVLCDEPNIEPLFSSVPSTQFFMNAIRSIRSQC